QCMGEKQGDQCLRNWESCQGRSDIPLCHQAKEDKGKRELQAEQCCWAHAPAPARSQLSASSRSTNHFVGKTAGPSIASWPALGKPAGIKNAKLRTPAAP